ncbi:11967_t:CDS:2 [Ambispora gerdemannii]|uniref:11967_t:CDS:1 n=1 Tax=Ambispora gerdemannii TaxID=144530 RepID=A0A9N8WNJ8_9GLOM|nr:11967_t:CDS:2 [Ambispora gerdemannii]
MPIPKRNTNSSTISGSSSSTRVDERIILNVAYPDTLLGTMFQERNAELLHPRNENEYFIDRNGRAFHYIMEYYRTGKVVWGGIGSDRKITRRELDEELDYFLIPPLTPAISLAMDFEAFIKAMMQICVRAFHLAGETSIKVTATDGQYLIVRYLNQGTSVHVTAPKIGKTILKLFGKEIHQHLQRSWPVLRWEPLEIKQAYIVHLCLRKDQIIYTEDRPKWH